MISISLPIAIVGGLVLFALMGIGLTIVVHRSFADGWRACREKHAAVSIKHRTIGSESEEEA